MDLRHPKRIDLNPTAGNSWFGLTRKQAKILALVFITLGLALSTPPFIPSPDDFLNVFIAKYLTEWFGFSQITALTLTYTVIAWGLFLIGLWIYPHHTYSLFNGYINKLQRQVKRLRKRPVLLLVMALIAYLMLKMYMKILGG